MSRVTGIGKGLGNSLFGGAGFKEQQWKQDKKEKEKFFNNYFS
jgi:hypothetical protein